MPDGLESLQHQLGDYYEKSFTFRTVIKPHSLCIR